jgi:hypothetical protein
MWYRVLPPQQIPSLDALVAAVLPAVLGLARSFVIRAPADWLLFRGHNLAPNRFGSEGRRAWFAACLAGSIACLVAHLCRRIDAGPADRHRRLLQGLPRRPFLRRSVEAAFLAGFVVTALLAARYVEITSVPIRAPDPLEPEYRFMPIVAEAGGRIQKWYVTPHTVVRAGDPVVQLDTSGLMVWKQTIETQIHQAESDGRIPRSQLAALYGRLRGVQMEMGSHTIVTPEDGEVVAVFPWNTDTPVRTGEAVAVVICRKTAGREAEQTRRWRR